MPSDWEIHPTYPRHAVPYFLAPLWDQDVAAKAETKRKDQVAARRQAQAKDEGRSKVPRELHEKLKKAKAAKGLLKDLEEQVRMFVKGWEEKTNEEKGELDSEDEEIVFVGRNGHMRDVPPSPKFRDGMEEEEFERDRLVFGSFANDQGASFGQVPHIITLTVLMLIALQTLACSFYRFLLWPSYVVSNHWRSCSQRGIRRHTAEQDR